MLKYLIYWSSKIAYRCIFRIFLILGKAGAALGRQKVIGRRFGTVHLYGPKPAVLAMAAAVEELRGQDEGMYNLLVSGRGLIIYGGSDNNFIGLEYGFGILAIKFMASREALVSLFVFWLYFQENITNMGLANKTRRTSAMTTATQKTEEWLRHRNFREEIAKWMGAGGLQKNTLPPTKGLKKSKAEKGEE